MEERGSQRILTTSQPLFDTAAIAAPYSSD